MMNIATSNAVGNRCVSSAAMATAGTAMTTAGKKTTNSVTSSEASTPGGTGGAPGGGVPPAGPGMTPAGKKTTNPVTSREASPAMLEPASSAASGERVRTKIAASTATGGTARISTRVPIPGSGG